MNVLKIEILMMNSEMSRPHCEYRRLENGIHEFVFLSNTRLAIDDYFAILETTRFARGEDTPDVIRLLIELSQPGMPPVAYMMQRYRDFVKAHKNHMPTTRVVYLYRSGFIPSLARSFIGLVSERKHAYRRFFPVNERAQAEEWLLEVPSSRK
jgi:hypothetical protein